MNKKEIKESFDKIEPNDIQKKRMINNIMGHSRTEKTKLKWFPRKSFYTAAAAAICFITVFALSFQPIVNVFDKKTPTNSENILKTDSLDKIEDQVEYEVKNYDEIYSYLSANSNEYLLNGNNAEMDRDYTGSAPSKNSSDSGTEESNTAGSSNDYSDTNLQVAGVQEADIVKTDGNFIYAISNRYLYIVSAINGNLKIISKISRNDSENTDNKYYNNSYFIEMYITDNRLIAVRNIYSKTDIKESGAAEPDNIYDMIPEEMYYNQAGICIEIYDITDKTKPSLINTLGQSGSYNSSRMIGDSLYLISNHSIYNIDKDKPETYVPQLINGDTRDFVRASDVIINKDTDESAYFSQYLMISGIDTSGEGKIVSNKSLLGFGNSIYANKTNLYITAYKEIVEGNKYTSGTKLYRFSLDEGNVELKATGVVPGYILNQFSMDEYKGIFRIVTTVNSYNRSSDIAKDEQTQSSSNIASPSQNQQYNSLYTLNDKLEIIGKIENLAKNERVYSVRFDGNTGYFVTFRQVDPLFTVDLSDPQNPKILSELKIPGFSEYLHMYDDGLLFGLGRDADENSGFAGFLKLSMFDVTDPENVTEKHKLIIDGKYYSSASYNHKAILINSEKNIIAFPCENEYLVYSYSKDNGFKKEGIIKMYKSNEYYYNEMRGIYINDYLYVISPIGISSYSMTDYTYFGKVDFNG